MQGADYTWDCGCYSFCGNLIACAEHSPYREKETMAQKSGGAGAKGASGATGSRGAMGKRGSGSRSSTIPVKPKFEERNIPYYDDPQYKGKLTDIAGMCTEIRDLQKRKAKLDDMIKERTIVIRAIMEDIKADESWSVRSDDWTASFVKPQPRKTLVPELLIQAGVSMTQIEKGTKETPVTPYVTVRARGEEEE